MESAPVTRSTREHELSPPSFSPPPLPSSLHFCACVSWSAPLSLLSRPTASSEARLHAPLPLAPLLPQGTEEVSWLPLLMELTCAETGEQRGPEDPGPTQ